MEILKTNIQGPLIIESKVFGDSRGYFFESFNAREFKEKTGFDITFVHDNESMSSYGVMRGLHFQRPPYTQSKTRPLRAWQSPRCGGRYSQRQPHLQVVIG